MAKYPEIQTKMRKEVDDQIGDRLVMQEDKSNCHYVNAFISETFRFMPVTPVGVFHSNTINTKIGKSLLSNIIY